jgi:hypothetical protein
MTDNFCQIAHLIHDLWPCAVLLGGGFGSLIEMRCAEIALQRDERAERDNDMRELAGVRR